MEQLIAIILPDVLPQMLEKTRAVNVILETITTKEFEIRKQKTMRLTRPIARQIFQHMKDDDLYEDKISFVTSAPCVILLVEGKKGFERFHALIGGDDPVAERHHARQKKIPEDKSSLRARFGTDKVRNAIYASENAFLSLQGRHIFFPPNQVLERTIVVVKPTDNPTLVREIEQQIKDNGCCIVQEREAVLSGDIDIQLLSKPYVKENVDSLAEYLKSGPSTLLVVDGINAIDKIRLLLGPLVPSKAVACAPTSLRAQFGTSSIHNAVQCPLSHQEAVVAYGHWFKETVPHEVTFAMIKPNALMQYEAPLLAAIKLWGFKILRSDRIFLSKYQAQKFYKEHERKPFYDQLVEYMTSGPVLTLMLSREGAIKAWRHLIGPTNSEMAKKTAPHSLRARFGLDGTRNAVHGSDSPSSAVRELQCMFGSSRIQNSAEIIGSIKDRTQAPLTNDPNRVSMHRLLMQGLRSLSIKKPKQSTEACEFLAHWLLENNPRDENENARRLKDTEAKEATGASDGDDRFPNKGAKLEMPSIDEIHIIIISSDPGIDTSMVCDELASEQGYFYLDANTCLQELAESGGSGHEALAKALHKKVKSCAKIKIVLDNFPPDLSYYFAFEKTVTEVSAVLHLTMDKEDMTITPFQQFFEKIGRFFIINAAISAKDLVKEARNALYPRCIMLHDDTKSIREADLAEVARRFEMLLLSVEQLVKKEAARKTPSGVKLAELVRTGQVIPSQIIVELLRRQMLRRPGATFLMMKLPSSKELAELLEKTMGAPAAVLCFQTSPSRSTPVTRFYDDLRVLKTINVLGKDFSTCDSMSKLIAPFVQPQITVLLDTPNDEQNALLNSTISRFACARISPKDVLRAEVVRGSKDGSTIESLVANGEPVPTDLLVKLLRKFIYSSHYQSFLIEDFPHTLDQAQAFSAEVCPIHRAIKASDSSVSDGVLQYFRDYNSLITLPRAPENTCNIAKDFLQCTVVGVTLSDPSLLRQPGRLEEIKRILRQCGFRAWLYSDITEQCDTGDWRKYYNKMEAIRVMLRRSAPAKIALIDVPADLATMLNFESTICNFDCLVAIEFVEKAIGITSAFEDEYSSDEDDPDFTKDSTSAATSEDFVEVCDWFKTTDRLKKITLVDNFSQTLAQYLMPTVVLAVGHKSSQYEQVLRRDSEAHQFHSICTTDLFQGNESLSADDMARLLRSELVDNTYVTKFIISEFPRVVDGNYVHDQLIAFQRELGQIDSCINFSCEKVVLSSREPQQSELDRRTDEYVVQQQPVLQFLEKNPTTIPMKTIDASKSFAECSDELRACLTTSE